MLTNVSPIDSKSIQVENVQVKLIINNPFFHNQDPGIPLGPILTYFILSIFYISFMKITHLFFKI